MFQSPIPPKIPSLLYHLYHIFPPPRYHSCYLIIIPVPHSLPNHSQQHSSPLKIPAIPKENHPSKLKNRPCSPLQHSPSPHLLQPTNSGQQPDAASTEDACGVKGGSSTFTPWSRDQSLINEAWCTCPLVMGHVHRPLGARRNARRSGARTALPAAGI